MVHVSQGCAGIHKILYIAFRDDPLFQKLFNDKAKLLEFFKAIETLSVSRTLRSICVLEEGHPVSVAVLELANVSRLSVNGETLRHFIHSISPSLLYEVAGWSGESVKYWKSLRSIQDSCHLLFLASMVRGRGYGSLALKVAEGICRKLGKSWIVLDVDKENRALKLYYKRGFQPLGEACFSGRTYIIMGKPLQAHALISLLQ